MRRLLTKLAHGSRAPDRRGGEGSGQATSNHEDSTDVAEDTNEEHSIDQLGLLRLDKKLQDHHQSHGMFNVDIVAIHGLNGHRERTWTHKSGTFWLRDLLPEKLPGARIFTYGYPSQVFFNRSKAGIREYARQLLQWLENERLENKVEINRPIIFICHSLGGIVFKEAMNLAVDRFRDVCQSSKGVIFLGTPHRGSESANLGKVLGNIVNFAFQAGGVLPFQRTVKTSLLQDLSQDSRELTRIADDFLQRAPAFRITSFYEDRGILPSENVVVAHTSATIGLFNERPLPLWANHRDLCRFSGRSDDKYVLVVGEVQRIATEILEEMSQRTASLSTDHSYDDLERACVATLNTMDAGRYESGLEQQAKGTLSWVQAKPEYVHWKESDVSRLLWVTGHPGCGKTTLALFVTHALTDHIRPHDIVCRFFCNENEPSHDASALLRALIYQIISRRRRLLKVVRKASDRGGMQTLRQFDALWDIFVKVACDNRVASISIIIDGIEGYDRTTQTKLIRRISELIRSRAARQVKFFITSRPHALALQYIDVDPTQVLLLRMENEQQVIEEDVNLFIHQRLELLVRAGRCKSSTRDELEKILVSKAGRTFLWVSLILPLLEERRVLSTTDVTSIVAQLPPDLAVIYEKLLDMISPHERDLVARLLRLIVVSARALTGDELSILLEITPDHHSATSLEEDQLQMDSRMVLLALGPLVRVSDSKISLIHASLKDYLLDLGKTPSHRLSETFGVDMQRDTRTLVSACVYYLGLDEFGGEIFQREILGDNNSLSSEVPQAAEAEVTMSTLPFDIFNEPLFHDEQEQDIELGMQVANRYKLFDYAAVHWMSDLFRCDVGVVQDLVDPISVICGSDQIRLTNWFRYFWMRTGMTEQCIAADPLIVACYFGHVYLLQTYLDSLQECQSETLWTALLWAAREGHISCVKALLRHPKTTNIPKPSIFNIAPLHAAAQCGHLECVQALLEDDRIEVNSHDRDGRTALSLASANGHSDVVTALFLHKAIDVNLPDKSNYAAVFWWAVAVKSGPASSPFLTDLRVDLDHVDKHGRTPLSWAAEEGTETAVDGLIRSQRITIGLQDNKGRTPISYAAQNGHLEVVRLLYNSQPKQALTQDHTGRNAYSWAADQPNSHVLSELLKLDLERDDINGADVEDDNGWAPLAWALNPPGYPKNVRNLIESKKVDLNRRDKTEGRTPLSLAAAYGLAEIVDLLSSKKGIILDSRDVNGRTPLSYAAGRGNAGVVSKLLSFPHVDVNSTDKTGCTPLSWAAREGCCEVIPLLLSHPQIDCSVRDASGRLPLQVALAYGQDRAADILQANTVEARRDARR